MKHGKRFLWIVPLFCLLAACGGQGTQAESARWDTFHHEGDNVQLSLGMTRRRWRTNSLRQRVSLPRRTRTR